MKKLILSFVLFLTAKNAIGNSIQIQCSHKILAYDGKTIEETRDLALEQVANKTYEVHETISFPLKSRKFDYIRVTNLQCTFSDKDRRIAYCAGIKQNSSDATDFTHMGFSSVKSIETSLDGQSHNSEVTESLLRIEAQAIHNLDRTSPKTWYQSLRFHLNECETP